MFHKGTLDDSLKTIIPLSENEFRKIFKKYQFEYYCFDKRINCIRFIIGDMIKNYNIPTWLLIKLD